MATLNPELAELISLRTVEPGDMPFVWDSWLRSYRESPWAGVIPNNLYREVTQAVITELRARGAIITLAVRRDDPNEILGYVCHERVPGGVAVHYVFIKDAVRRQGLASELLSHARLSWPQGTRKFYTFRTRAASYFPDWKHEPAIARREKVR